jgi:RNA polymerase sigma factor (sigma-70 family)
MLSDVETPSLEERNQLFTENIRLAYWALGHLLERQPGLKGRLLRRYQWEDLEQLALVALLKSCAALDPARGALTTLLTTTLRRDLLSAVRQDEGRLAFATLTEKLGVALASPTPSLTVADRELVVHALAQLDELSCWLVRRRFGFDGGREWHLSEIARVLGVSKERARQMERGALDRLATMLAKIDQTRAD